MTQDLTQCFQLTACGDPQLLKQWRRGWQDVVDFQYLPVLKSSHAAVLILNDTRRDGSDSIQAGGEPVILEVAVLDVKPGQEATFESAFAQAQSIISRRRGYLSHELQRCIENTSRYVLLVRWDTLEDHTEGFRNSSEYQQWRELLHHFYDPFPVVEHFEKVF